MRTKTILVVEDDPVIAADLTAVLRGAGARVLSFQHSEAALRWLSEDLSDLVVVNFCQKYHEDGLEIARFIRGQYLTPVLLLTGARLADLKNSPYYYPGQEYLLKPFTHSQLLATVKAVLGVR